MITVKELIEKLGEFPDDYKVGIQYPCNGVQCSVCNPIQFIKSLPESKRVYLSPFKMGKPWSGIIC